MSAFIPIGECCLKGSKLPGEPRGVMQIAGSEGFENLRLDRYYARPREVRDLKTCIVLLYDIFGFSIVSALLCRWQSGSAVSVAVH